MNFYVSSLSLPVTELVLVASEHGLCRIDFGNWEQRAPEIARWVKRWWSEDAKFHQDPEPLAPAVNQLAEYAAGERQVFDLPFDMRGTPFQRQVWEALCTIPYGQTRSYGDIASKIGNSKASRAVGGANNQNPLSIVVPCHRVIGANGSMTGYGGGLAIKAYLLKLEGL